MWQGFFLFSFLFPDRLDELCWRTWVYFIVGKVCLPWWLTGCSIGPETTGGQGSVKKWFLLIMDFLFGLAPGTQVRLSFGLVAGGDSSHSFIRHNSSDSWVAFRSLLVWELSQASQHKREMFSQVLFLAGSSHFQLPSSWGVDAPQPPRILGT